MARRSGPTTRPWAGRRAGIALLPCALCLRLWPRSGRLGWLTTSWRGAQGIIDSTAEALKLWQAERETRAAEAVGEALASGDGPAERRVESARDGVTAPMDGRWPPPQGATLLGRRLEAPAEEPTLGTVLARRDVRVLGAAADLAARLKPGLREARGAPIPSGELLGDGAPGIWNVADAHGPGVRQTRDSDHLREHL